MTEITGLRDLVHRVLAHLEDGTYHGGFSEPFRRGSAAGTASIIEDPDEPGEFEFQVEMRVMRAPGGADVKVFRRLLCLNHAFKGRAAFALDPDGVVVLVAARPVRDLDPSEVVDLLLWTSEQADRFDDILLKEFGHEHSL
jgi:hypothetical protein